MNVVELFAGAGGAYLGLKRAGMECLCAVEWDKAAAATLAAVGAPVMHGDVRDLDRIAGYVDGRAVDALWSSFPCQAWSSAGKRLGAKDARNGWPWTVDAIDRFRPRWFMAENVVGLTHHRGGCARPAPGQARLFGDVYDPSDCPGCYLDWVIVADLRARFPACGVWEIDAADLGVPQHRRRIILWGGPAAPTKPAATHGPGCDAPWVSMGEALAVPIRGTRDRLAKPAPTITVGNGTPFADAFVRCQIHAELAAIRGSTNLVGLTWKECTTLQAFPVDWPFRGNVEDKYRQVGNAVAPPVAEAVGRAVIAADGGAR